MIVIDSDSEHFHSDGNYMSTMIATLLTTVKTISSSYNSYLVTVNRKLNWIILIQK